MVGAIDEVIFDRWKRMKAGGTNFHYRVPTELFSAILEYCFARNPHRASVACNYSQAPTPIEEETTFLPWSKRQSKSFDRLIHYIKYPSFFEKRETLIDLIEDDDPWFDWASCLGEDF